MDLVWFQQLLGKQWARWVSHRDTYLVIEARPPVITIRRNPPFSTRPSSLDPSFSTKSSNASRSLLSWQRWSWWMRCQLAGSRRVLQHKIATMQLLGATSRRRSWARAIQRMRARARMANLINLWTGRTSISLAKPCSTTPRRITCLTNRPAKTSTHESWSTSWNRRCRKTRRFMHLKC